MKNFRTNLLRIFIIFIFTLGAFVVKATITSSLTNTEYFKFSYNSEIEIDSKLEKQRYTYAVDASKKYITVIVLYANQAVGKEYMINNGGATNINVPKGYDFIISLHENSLIGYKWTVCNQPDLGLVELYKDTKIQIPNLKGISQMGMNNDRRNFYFKAKDRGMEEMRLKYEHVLDNSSEYFVTNLKVEIE